MRKFLAVLTATALLSASHVSADSLAPTPQIIAEYDRSFIERSGAQTFGEMLDTGIIRYFFTGGRDLLVLLNGRPYTTTNSGLDSIPLSAVERIEVLRAESLGTLGGHAAVRGAINLVLRNDLDGFDVRTVTRSPSRDGGNALQGSAVWGGTVGKGGHLTVSVDILDREEIVGSTREHSRSEWQDRGSFDETKNVSHGGNTVFIFDFDERKLRSISLGDCDPAHGYTGPLSNPPGITSGDKGCGFAYGNFWWDSSNYKQENTILNLNQPLDEHTELHVDANVTQGRGAFRYAPSVGTFSFDPQTDSNLLKEINSKAGITFDTNRDALAVAHRFIGHGNRDWRTNAEQYDISATIRGRLSENLGFDAYITAFKADARTSGDTFVDTTTITTEINEGRYDLTDPLSKKTNHLRAIEISSLTEEDNFNSKFLKSRFALEGAGAGINGRKTAWTAGVEFTKVEANRLLEFRAIDDSTRIVKVDEVLGSGGTSYAGKRNVMGAFAEVSLPIADSVDTRAAAQINNYNDVGWLRAWRLGAEYHPNDILTLRGSWSTGDGSPSFYHLNSTESQDHPYVRCIPEKGQPTPRMCDRISIRQVTRLASGNPELKPSGSKRLSFGIETRREPFYFIADWYRLTTSDLPGSQSATWAMLNYEECDDGPTSGGEKCIERRAGEITIHDSFSNLVSTEISGVNARFGNRVETDWGFFAMRGFWRYVSNSETRIAGEVWPQPLPRNAVRIVSSAGRDNLTAFWALNYRSEIDNAGSGRFSSWIGHDVTLDWREPFGHENMRVTAGVYNVTDEKLSTHTANPNRSDGPVAAGWGRTFFVTLNMRF